LYSDDNDPFLFTTPDFTTSTPSINQTTALTTGTAVDIS